MAVGGEATVKHLIKIQTKLPNGIKKHFLCELSFK